MDNQYLCWLMNQAQLEAEGPGGYLQLCEILQSTAFLTYVRMDENRKEEALELREEWADSDDGDISQLEKVTPYSCTMLELLITLARRMRYQMLDSQFEAGVGKWIFEMLENAGFADCTNAAIGRDPYIIGVVRCHLMDIIHRRYDRDGNGSFFPLENPREDQRETELLTQMNNYLEEKYDLC